jgi:membrane protein DedA with SNARE-associated domain
MHWPRFLAFNALGAALWVAAWTSVGYFCASHIDTIYGAATRYDTYVAVALGALALAYGARRVARARRAHAASVT